MMKVIRLLIDCLMQAIAINFSIILADILCEIFEKVVAEYCDDLFERVSLSQ